MNRLARNPDLMDRFQILPAAAELVANSENDLRDLFAETEERSECLQYRVLDAFRRQQVSSRHFNPTTGYGYGDEGREKLAAVFADVFGTEDAIVSPLIMSGTHAISMALFGLLRPGDYVLCITGEPYDTMQQVIRGNESSLESSGVRFETMHLTAQHTVDFEAIKAREDAGVAPDLIYIQRSTGYDLRPAFTVEQIGEMIREMRGLYPGAVILVDNCYGEFVNDEEPSAVGADLLVGSLIKNPGGGLAQTGGYITGQQPLIERIAARYSAPGVGREIGSYAGGYQYLFQGLFMAPHAVAQALKGVMLAADVFERAGYDVSPGPRDVRGDITQTILFHDEQPLTDFVRGVQRASAIDAHVVPYAWDMPGYEDQVIMAAGTFVQGASLELTADAPIRPPYAAYLQGGLTYAHAKFGVLCGLSDVLRSKN